MKKNRLIALAIGMNMMFNLTSSIPVFAEDSTSVYKNDGYTVYYSVVNDWDNNQNVVVKIENNGNDVIENWAVEYSVEGEISGLWNARIYNQEEADCVFKNTGYNHAIKAGETVEFGYTITGDSLKTPEKITICSKTVDITDECDVYYNIVNDFGDTYQAEIVICNNTDSAIESWRLIADTANDIGNVWNADVYEASDGVCTLVNDENTYNIEAGGKVTVSIEGRKKSDDVISFDKFRLSTVRINLNGDREDDDDYTYIPWLPEGMDILIAYAEYINDTLFFEWAYRDNSGVFSIYENTTDGRKKIAEVQNESTYEYKVGKISGSRTFSVEITDNGKTLESDPITVYIDDEGYVQTEYPDTDGDGVADVFEHVYGTNLNKTDTDDDGLNDYEEIYIFGTDPLNADCDGDNLPDGFEINQTGTDPLMTDSLGEGKTDDLYDMDNDMLTNIQEYEYGTNPLYKDTDVDGLDDYSEIFTYKTDPVSADTDNDNVCDGDEIALKLDPNNPRTYGCPDAEYTVVQKLDYNSDNLSAVNDAENNPFEISVEMDCAGAIENNLAACESGYTAIIENESIVGIVPEISYSDKLSVESFKLTFKLDGSAMNNTNECHNEEDVEFEGIERFTVFKMFEDYNMLLPIETNYDPSSNEIYVNTDEVGTYCLVDVELWINMLESQAEAYTGYYDSEGELSEDLPEENVSEKFTDDTSVSSGNSVVSSLYTSTENVSKGKKHVIFVIDSRKDSYIHKIAASVENKIYDLQEQFDKKDIDVIVLSSNGNLPINVTQSLKKHSNVSKVEGKDLAVKYRQAYQDGFDISKIMDKIVDDDYDYVQDGKTYFFWICDNSKDVKFEKKSGYNLIKKLNEKNVNVSIISNPEEVNSYDYGYTLVRETGGILLNYNGASNWNFTEDVRQHVLGSYTRGDTFIVTPTNYKKVKLDGEITKSYQENSLNKKYSLISDNPYDRVKNANKFIDTDNDGLYDFEEIMFFWNDDDSSKDNQIMQWDNDEDEIFPTFQDLCNKLSKEYKYFDKDKVINQLNKKQLDEQIRVLPIRSDPTLNDSDNDGITDYNERVAIEEYKEYEQYKKTNNNADIREYYACTLNPIKKDTLQTIFSNIKSSKTIGTTSLTFGKKPKKDDKGTTPVVIDVTNNDITINANVLFPENFSYTFNSEDKYEFYDGCTITFNDSVTLTYFSNCVVEKKGEDGSVISSETIELIDKEEERSYSDGDKITIKMEEESENACVTVKVSDDVTAECENLLVGDDDLQEKVEAGISAWEISGFGSKFDFYPGLKYNVITNVDTSSTTDDQSTLKVNYVNFRSGSVNGITVTKSNVKHIVLYNKWENPDAIVNTMAHEFGHVLGLKDAYSGSESNKIDVLNINVSPYKKSIEIPSNEIMRGAKIGEKKGDRKVNANDIEMIMVCNTMGETKSGFSPNDYWSPAIRTPYVLYMDKNKAFHYLDKYEVKLKEILSYDKFIDEINDLNNGKEKNIEVYYK